MDTQGRIGMLRVALVLVGLACISLYPLMIVWPSGWAWHVGHSDYAWMIIGLYATLGVFLVRASVDPYQHLSLIWFTVWSSLVHAAIMAIQAIQQPGQRGHLWGDVPGLVLAALVLAALTPRRKDGRPAS